MQQQTLEIWGGIECTINRVGAAYFDQLEYSGHYHRPNDIDLVADLGIRKIRYPVLWERHQPAADAVPDWTFAGASLERLRHFGIDPIVGLVHHGSGPAWVNFFDGSFEDGLARYAAQVAERFPEVRHYTPVNEPLTTARFCGLYGLWYPHGTGGDTFARILISECKATVLAMQAIRTINPEAQLVQTEDLGKTYSTPLLRYQADFENERRWLAFDLISGKVDTAHPMWSYLRYCGIPESDLTFFLEHPTPPDITGLNYYVTSERYLDEDLDHYPVHTHGGNGRHRYADVEAVRVGFPGVTGPEQLFREAWDRYRQPMAITEVHLHCTRDEQLRWFYQIWKTATHLREAGLDIRAVTAWALLGSYGWDRLLTAAEGTYESGVFNLCNGQPRPTGLATLIRDITHGRELHHPALAAPGWWQTSNRLIYRKDQTNMNHTYQPPRTSPLLILGKTGTLGKAFARICAQKGIAFQLLSREDVDITDGARIEAVVARLKPWGIVNTTGYVRVDDAEDDFDQCYQSNCEGPALLAECCRRHGVRLVTFSSDLVFDGHKGRPYVESDPVSPLNLYGKSKAMAEQQVLAKNEQALVIRTSAFFGPWDDYNFVSVLLRELRAGRVFTAADDIYVSPTYVPDLVRTTLDLLLDEARGIYHVANSDTVSWAELALMVARRADLDASLIDAVRGATMRWRAKRPWFSALHSEKGVQLPSLTDALNRYFAEVSQAALASPEAFA